MPGKPRLRDQELCRTGGAIAWTWSRRQHQAGNASIAAGGAIGVSRSGFHRANGSPEDVSLDLPGGFEGFSTAPAAGRLFSGRSAACSVKGDGNVSPVAG